MITLFVPTSVGPTKLDLVLSYCTGLSDESKQRVILLIDINKLGILLGGNPITARAFYDAYDNATTYDLEACQHNLQVEWNTRQYHNGYSPVQGHDF